MQPKSYKMWGKYMYGLLWDGFVMGLDCPQTETHNFYLCLHMFKNMPRYPKDTQAQYCHI